MKSCCRKPNGAAWQREADVKFMLDEQRQNTLIQALLRDEVEKALYHRRADKGRLERQPKWVARNIAHATSSSRKKTKPRQSPNS